MQEHKLAFEKCPQKWIEERDIERICFDKATWIPLQAEMVQFEHGRHGTIGHRYSYLNYESIIVPIALKEEFKETDWQSISRNSSDHAWVDESGFQPPGCFGGDQRVLYPVIQRSFETG